MYLQGGDNYPILQCPPTVFEVADMVDGGRQYKIVNYPAASATDSNGSPLPVSYSHLSGAKYYVDHGVYTVEATATSGISNNMARCTFTVEVRPNCKSVILSYFCLFLLNVNEPMCLLITSNDP